MAFGSTLQQKKPIRANTANMFLPLTEGTRDVRILGAEVQSRVLWYNKKPVRIARLVGDSWRGHADESWYECPMNEWVKTLDDAEQKRAYAKIRFMVNVFDRTPVITEDGVTYWPNKNGKYFKKAEKGLIEITGTPEPHNKVMVIDQSGGAEGGKHFLQSLITAAEQLMSMKTGKSISIHEGDLRIVTKGEGIETNRSVYAGFNQEPLEVTEMYDLESFTVVWPHAAQRALLEGGDYNTIMSEFNIPMYPSLVSI